MSTEEWISGWSPEDVPRCLVLYAVLDAARSGSVLMGSSLAMESSLIVDQDRMLRQAYMRSLTMTCKISSVLSRSEDWVIGLRFVEN